MRGGIWGCINGLELHMEVQHPDSGVFLAWVRKGGLFQAGPSGALGPHKTSRKAHSYLARADHSSSKRRCRGYKAKLQTVVTMVPGERFLLLGWSVWRLGGEWSYLWRMRGRSAGKWGWRRSPVLAVSVMADGVAVVGDVS